MGIPAGLIIVIHSGIRKILEQEVLDAIPASYLRLDRKMMHLESNLPLELSSDFQWENYKAAQLDWFKSELKPILNANPTYRILYFGLTHIPLAMHLGYLIGDLKQVEIYLCNYQTGRWSWPNQPGDRVGEIKVTGLPLEMFGGTTSVAIRMSAYAEIPKGDTLEVMGNGVHEVDILLENAREDLFGDRQQMENVADAYSEAIRQLSTKLPALAEIHVFAAVPTGLAFLMGQKISPNKHPLVSVYQYRRVASPRYKLAMTLQTKPVAEEFLDEEDKKLIQDLRDKISRHIKDEVVSFAKDIAIIEGSWLPRFYHQDGDNFFDNLAWVGLAPLYNTPIIRTGIAISSHQDSEIFFDNDTWYFSDQLILALWRKMLDEQLFLRAIRLFLFHESLHLETHGVTSRTSRDIGRFPKVVETLDYQADAYALLYEVARSYPGWKREGRAAKNPFLEAIDTMIQTMWAFDANGDPDQLPVRRINRYLIWYFQWLQINHQTCNSLKDILKIISQKPDLEIKGLSANLDERGRYCYKLHAIEDYDLGIAVIYRQRLHRRGHDSGAIDMLALISGFRERDGNQIRDCLHGLLDSVVQFLPAKDH